MQSLATCPTHLEARGRINGIGLRFLFRLLFGL